MHFRSGLNCSTSADKCKVGAAAYFLCRKVYVFFIQRRGLLHWLLLPEIDTITLKPGAVPLRTTFIPDKLRLQHIEGDFYMNGSGTTTVRQLIRSTDGRLDLLRVIDPPGGL